MNSSELFKKAEKLLPGGVNSPVRSFASVGGSPIYVTNGKGSRIFTVEEKSLVDFCCSWGPLILGHAHENVVKAVCRAAQDGLSFGINHPNEVRLAELIQEAFPGMERLRLVNSGTEATMTALRIARGATGKNKIIKCSGCYHGHSDSLLVKGGSGLLSGGIASSAGVPGNVVGDTLVIPYNDLDALEQILSAHNDIAAFILEPVAGNMGLVPPKNGYLQQVRELTEKHGVVLIFDEVITGFRFCFGGCGQLYGVNADLTCLGKIVGGGMPMGVVGGKKELMDHLAPCGSVYQAGTLSGNPLASAAGIAMLEELKFGDIYKPLQRATSTMCESIREELKDKSVFVRNLGSMFTIFFHEGPVNDGKDSAECDTEAYARFFSKMLGKGYYLPPAQFEACFVSAAHTKDELINFGKAVIESVQTAGGER